MRSFVLAVCASTALTGSPMAQTSGPTPERAKALARAEMVNRLRDPDSARFRDVRYSRRPDGRIIFCGEINATNGMGGYTGYTQFITSVTSGLDVNVEIATEQNLSGRMLISSAWPVVCEGEAVRPITF